MGINASNNPFSCKPAIIGGAGSSQDGWIDFKGFSLEDQLLLLFSSSKWKLNSIPHTNTSAVEFTIPFSASGKRRIERIAATNQNTFIRVPGVESSGTLIAPQLPPNTIEATFYIVSDNEISEPSQPIVGNVWVRKESLSDTVIASGGTDLILPNYGRFNYILRCDSVGNFKGVSGNFLGIDNELVVGTEVKITCDTDYLPTLDHGASIDGNLPFNFPGGQNFKLQRNTVAVFRFNGLDLMFESYSNIGPETLALAKTYTDTKSAEAINASRTTPQFNITGNITLTNAHNGAFLKIKASCTITVPSGMIAEFNCIARTFTGATVTWIEGSGVTFDAPLGKMQDPFRMISLLKDGNTETYILTGETRV